MRLNFNAVIDEYEKYLGYGVADSSISGICMLLKYAASQNETTVPKMVVVVEAATTNIRNSATAKAVITELIQRNTRVPIPTENNLLIIVLGHNGQGHHFAGKNIVFCNQTKDKVRVAKVSQEMWNEFVAVRDLKRYVDATNQMHQSFFPELQVHNITPLYFLIAVTILSYFTTMLATEKYGYSPQTVLEAGQSYRLFTYMFAHGSIRHLLGNMISLFVIGRIVMEYEGALRFSAIYFCGGIFSALTDCVLCEYAGAGTSVITVGASGAIFALMGAMVTEAFMHHGMEQMRKQLLFNVLIVFILSSLGATTNGRVHFFGLLAGFAITLLIYLGERVSGVQQYQTAKRKWIDERRKCRGYKEPENNWYCGPSH